MSRCRGAWWVGSVGGVPATPGGCSPRGWWRWPQASLATGPLFSRLADGGVPRDVESVAAYDVIRSGDDSAGTVVGVVDRVDPASPQVRAAIQAAAGRIANLDGVRQVDHPYQTATSSSPSIANDGTAVLISATLSGLDRTARDAAVTAISAELHALTARPADRSDRRGGWRSGR